MRDYYLAHDGASRQRAAARGAGREFKVCPACKVEKPRTEFTVYRTGKRVGHLAGRCKECRNADMRGVQKSSVWYETVGRKSKLKRIYGITPEQYDAMLAAQGGGCAICHSKTPYSRGYKRAQSSAFCIDHDHVTGRVRGLLCTRCNRAIGLLNDNPAVIAQAALYLS